MPKALPAKQERFCQNIVADPKANGTQAAIDAGYSPRSAASIASELLKKPEIKKRIRDLNKAAVAVSEVTAVRVVEEMNVIAMADMASFVESELGKAIRVKAFSEMPQGATRCIKKLRVKRRVLETNTSGTDDKPGPTTAVVEETVEIELWSKTEALDMLARKHALYDHEEGDGDQPRTVNFNFTAAVKPGK